MIVVVRVISTELDSLARRVVKFFKLGKNVHTARQAAPFGFDSNPIPKNMQAIFAETSVDGRPVIIGYLNLDQIVSEGESRMYSVDTDGNLKMYVTCKSDGTLLLLSLIHI